MTSLTAVAALIVIAAAMIIGVVIGKYAYADTKTINSTTTPTMATVELAPDGSAYCPSDPATPHPLPCINKP